MENIRVWDKTAIIGALALVGTVISTVAGAMNVVSPETAMWVGAFGAAITAFCGRVQGSPTGR